MIDRKAILREYKERQHPMGVYRVHNTTGRKSLVGSSRNLTAILNRHKAQLQMKGHPSRELQSDWNELGSDAFLFEVLDTLPPSEDQAYDPTDDLRALEELWIEKLEALGEQKYSSR